MRKLILSILLWALGGGEKDMVAVYVALIVAGRRTFGSVPKTISAQVRDELVALELGSSGGGVKAGRGLQRPPYQQSKGRLMSSFLFYVLGR